MSILIGYRNLIDDATLTANGAFSSSFPLSYLKQRELARVAVSTTATKIYIDHGSAMEARLAWIAAHANIVNGDTVTMDRGSTLGGTEVYAGTALSAWPFTPLIGSRDGSSYGIPIVMASANSARYTTLTLPAGFHIGRIFIGPAFDPEVGPTELGDDWKPPNSTLTRSTNGADWTHQRAEQRAEGVVYGSLTYAEADLMYEIILEQSIVKEVVYIPDSTDRSRSQLKGFLGTLKALAKTEYPYWAHNGIAIGLEERGGAP